MFVNLTISVPAASVAQLNQLLVNDSTKPFEGVQGCVKLLEAIQLGTKDGIVYLATTDTNPSVAPSSGGISNTYDLS